MDFIFHRAARRVGLALLWLLGSLLPYRAAAGLVVRYWPASPAHVLAGNINRAEYFVDADPGLGNGTAIPLTPGADVSGLTFTVNLSTLTTGFHRLSTRTQDVAGVWSLTNTRSFYFQNSTTTTTPPLANITKAEYFIDTEPGLGNGINIPIATPGTDVSGLGFIVNLTPLTTGFHRLSTRTRDANGVWSLTNTRSFYYQNTTMSTTPPLAAITKAEYFIDAEPGLGNGVDIPVATPGTDVSGLAFTVNLSTLTNGFHRLSTRTRDANGVWSLTNSRSFYYLPASAVPGPPAAITRVEYYVDTDPGFGSATAVPLAAPATDVANLGYAADLSSLSNGSHRFFIRARDANGKWSLVSSSAFTKSGCASALNYAGGLPAASYLGTNTSGTLTSAASVAFNTDPAAPTTSNSPYYANTGTLLADLGTAQTISELRVRLTAQGVANSTTITIQTAATTAGPFTTIDTYVASLVANTPLLVARPLATPVAARVVRFQFQNANTGNLVVVSGAGIFNFNCVTPSITAVAPNVGPAGTVVTITGANLQGTTALTFAGTSNNTVATGFTVSPDGTQITGVVVPGGAATGNLTATTPNGTTNGVNYTVTAGPALTSIAPPSGPVGSTVVLNGTSLTGTTLITFAGAANNTVATGYAINAAGTQITGVVVPSGAATGSVRVTTPVGTSNGIPFTVTLPTPVLTSLAPPSGPVGTSVTISGANLGGATSVSFNGTVVASASFTSSSPTSLVLPVPTGATTGPVTVTTPSGTSNGLTFTVTAPQLVVSQSGTAYPSGGPVYSFGNQVQHTSSPAVAFTLSNVGTALLTISSVTVTGDFATSGSTPTSVAAGGAGTVSVGFTPTALGARAGTLVIVSNAGTYTLNLSGTGTTAPLSTITSFTPATGPAGTLVTLTGTNLDGATAVTFNGTPAGPITNNTATSLTVPAPAGGTDGQICVTTTGGTACSGASYLYPPAIATGTISASSYCTGNTLTVPFSTATARYPAGNVFNFQLSDASGVFAANAPLLGTLQSVNATGGVLTGVIPQATPAGSGYRVRVVASNPAVTGTANGANLTIGTTPVSQATGPASVANGATINLGVTPTYPGATYSWSGPGGFTSTLASPSTSTTTPGVARYFVTVTLGSCSSSSFVDVTVQPSTLPILTLAPITGTFCSGTAYALSFSVTGNPFPAGTTITAELSNSSGSFVSPTVIGSVTFTGVGNGSLPVTVPRFPDRLGTSYRVRLVASAPYVSGNTNPPGVFGVFVDIPPLPPVTASSNSPITAGNTLELQGGAGGLSTATFAWTFTPVGGSPVAFSNAQNPSIPNAQPSQAGRYRLTVTGPFGCTDTASVRVLVTPVAPVTTLALGPLAGPLCAGTGYTLSYTAGGPSFGAGNVITAQLSDASGSFATPVSIGAVSTTAATAGTLDVVVPATTVAGGGYRIRLVSSSPVIISNDNGSALTITNLNTAAAGSNSPVTVGSPISLTATGISGATYSWTGPNGYTATGPNQTLGSATAADAGTYSVTISLNGCSTTASTIVVVNPASVVASIQTSSLASGYCAGTALSVSFTASGFAAGNVFTAQLSAAGGSFASPVSIGTLSGTTSGTIAAVLPAGTAPGVGYRIRVVGSQPATVGADNGADLLIGAANAYTWLGAVSTSWGEPGNWSCGAVPTATSNVVIPAGLSTYPVTSTGSTAHDLTVATGATLTLTGEFALTGNLTNDGTLAAGTSTLLCSGTASQTLGGSGALRLYDLELRNAAGATLLSPLGVRHVLLLTAGDLASGGYLTLLSDAPARRWS